MLYYSIQFHFVLLLSGILQLTCAGSQSDEDYTMADSTFTNIYAEMIVLTEQYSYPSLKQNKTPDEILEKYNINYEQFQRQVEQYKKNPEKWGVLYPQVIKKLEKLIEDIKDHDTLSKSKSQKY